MLTSISRNFCKLKHMQAMDVPPLPPSVQNKIGQTGNQTILFLWNKL